MGHVLGAFGVRGWIKVFSDTEYADSLFDHDTWWLQQRGQWRAYEIEEGEVHPKHLVVKLKGVADRDAAATLKGSVIAIPRSALPEPDSNEYYWTDLIGLTVINHQQQTLGVVKQLLATGANDVLVVHDGSTERLIPFVGTIIGHIDLAAGTLQADWGLDY